MIMAVVVLDSSVVCLICRLVFSVNSSSGMLANPAAQTLPTSTPRQTGRMINPGTLLPLSHTHHLLHHPPMYIQVGEAGGVVVLTEAGEEDTEVEDIGRILGTADEVIMVDQWVVGMEVVVEETGMVDLEDQQRTGINIINIINNITNNIPHIINIINIINIVDTQMIDTVMIAM